MKRCPCHSGAEYKVCCKPFHEGKLPATALDLMRSRYAAYALNLADYIISTTHPDNPQDKRAISQFSKSTSFNDLKILDFQQHENTATVTFTAYLSQGTQDATFTEKSHFKRVDGRWLYKKGEVK